MNEPVDRPTPVTQHIANLLELRKNKLGIELVFYGDQAKFPKTPTACVESAPFTRELEGIGAKGRTRNWIRVNIIIYCGRVDQSGQITRKQCEELGERVMDLLHEDVTMNGLVTHGSVTAITPGYSTRTDGMMHAVRIDWQGQTKTMIV